MTVPQGTRTIISTYMRTGSPLGGIYTGTRIRMAFTGPGVTLGVGRAFWQGLVLFLVFRHGHRVLQFRTIWMENRLCRSRLALRISAHEPLTLFRRDMEGGGDECVQVRRTHQTNRPARNQCWNLFQCLSGTKTSELLGFVPPSTSVR